MRNGLFLFLIIFCIFGASFADVPMAVNYQGKLFDSSGGPIDGTKALGYKVYDDTNDNGWEATDPVGWQQTPADVSISYGLFSDELDFSTGYQGSYTFNSLFNSGHKLFIEVYVGSAGATTFDECTALSPPEPFRSTPYAFYASKLTSGGNNLQEAYNQSGTADPQITIDATNGSFKVGGGSVADAAIYASSDANSEPAIYGYHSTSGTGDRMGVRGDYGTSGVRGYLGAQVGGTNVGVYGQYDGKHWGELGTTSTGIKGHAETALSSPSDQTAIYATVDYTGTGTMTNEYATRIIADINNADGAITNQYGLYSETKKTDGAVSNTYGVYATVSGATSNYAVYGLQSTSSNYGYLGSDNYGVFGSVNNDAEIGVYGENISTLNSGDEIGVKGEANGADAGGTSVHYGLYGEASGGGTNYAGYFNGGAVKIPDGTDNPSGTWGAGALYVKTADGEPDTLKLYDAGSSSWINVGVGGGGGATDNIHDADNNTRVTTENAANEDYIRFFTAGTERGNISPTGNIWFANDLYLDGGFHIQESGSDVMNIDGSNGNSWTAGNVYMNNNQQFYMKNSDGTDQEWITPRNATNDMIMTLGKNDAGTNGNNLYIIAADGTSNIVQFTGGDQSTWFYGSLVNAGGTNDVGTDANPFHDLNIDNQIVFNGSSFNTALQFTDPTAARTITFPDASGTVALMSDINDNYVDGVSFNDGTNTLTLTRTGSLSDLTTTIDNEADDLSDNVINDLSNVNASPTDGQVLAWNNTAGEWQAVDNATGTDDQTLSWSGTGPYLIDIEGSSDDAGMKAGSGISLSLTGDTLVVTNTGDLSNSNELITSFTWTDSNDSLEITEAGETRYVTIDNEADDVTLADVQNACSNDFHNIGGTDAVDDADSVVGNEVVTGLTFNTGTGDLSLTQNAGTSPITANLDGRYALASGNITGSGTATQVAFFNGDNSITSSESLYWDNTNSRLGIGTGSPGEKLDVNGNIELNGNQIKNMRIENRTSDPASPQPGQIWYRTDL